MSFWRGRFRPGASIARDPVTRHRPSVHPSVCLIIPSLYRHEVKTENAAKCQFRSLCRRKTCMPFHGPHQQEWTTLVLPAKCLQESQKDNQCLGSCECLKTCQCMIFLNLIYTWFSLFFQHTQRPPDPMMLQPGTNCRAKTGKKSF